MGLVFSLSWLKKIKKKGQENYQNFYEVIQNKRGNASTGLVFFLSWFKKKKTWQETDFKKLKKIKA